MTLTASPEPVTLPRGSGTSRTTRALALLGGLWLILFVASLFAPPILDDADGTHANAARQMVLSGDWVTLRVNNVRYLEKAPLPYWIAAASFGLFGFNTFAAHLPQALAVLLLMLLGFHWSQKAFGDRAALYTGLAVLTSAGVFLFTRIFLPDPLLSLLLAAALYCLLKSLDPAATPGAPRQPANLIGSPLYPYALWTTLALAVLTKGLVALVFFFGTAIVYLALTGEYRQWRRLRPFSGLLLMTAIAAPWHILAGLRNTGGMNGHGFFWFYFINEHVLRFLGRRIPMDYNKLPGYLYWSLHLVWLFPWALFSGLLLRNAYAGLKRYNEHSPLQSDQITYWQPFAVAIGGIALRDLAHIPYLYTVSVAIVLFVLQTLRRRQSSLPIGTPLLHARTSAQRTTLLLTLFSAIVLLFFSLSTNQEYYTLPAYLPLLMLLAAALAQAEQAAEPNPGQALVPAPYSLFPVFFAHAAVTTIGLAVAAALTYGLWTSRHLAFVPDIGELLAHRGVGDYTLSMSGLFDLTGPSFAALRLPASLALAAFSIGPAAAWLLRKKRRHLAATTTLALTSAVFLIAAHIALVRFSPMLSSQDFAQTIQQLEASHQISPDNTLLLYGDQAYGSSIPFYLNRPLSRPALLVDGRSSSMLFGSTFPDAQPLFLTPAQLLAQWGTGERKILFVPINHRDDVDHLLGPHQFLLKETSGKALLTDRPLDLDPARPLDSSQKGGLPNP
jgi:4-amino-4-deoxy-L-arabinose transferase-like glycosyltransferase